MPAMRGRRAWEARSFLERLLRARELVTMALVAVVAGGLWVFLEVAEAVTDDEVRALDRSVLLAMREPSDPGDPLGPRWSEEMGRDLTALGSTAILALVSAAAALFLWMARRPRSVALVLVAFAGGQILSLLLKRGFARPRPELALHESYVYTVASFPSGHSMMAAVVYLTLGALLARVLPRRRMKLLVIACALGATALTGVSRVYLGVHWPTDVLAGWAIGASWAVGCWLAADVLDRRRSRGTMPEGRTEGPSGDRQT